jgi:DNA-binding transcriptional regulator YiaG
LFGTITFSKNMTKLHRTSQSETEPKARTVKMLLSGWSLLQALESRRLDQKTLAAYCGLTETTLSNWTAGATDLSQLEALLRLLERLPEESRVCLINSMLRVFPTLDDTAFVHDPIAVDRLYELLRRTRGVTFIQGRSDFLRTFVLTALGHSASRVGSSLRPIAGIDLHAETSLVPVPGVVYLGYPKNPTDLLERVRAHWPPTRFGNLVLLNRIWCQLPELQPELLRVAEIKHVIVADDTNFDPQSLRQRLGDVGIPAQLLTVSEWSGSRINVRFADA